MGGKPLRDIETNAKRAAAKPASLRDIVFWISTLDAYKSSHTVLFSATINNLEASPLEPVRAFMTSASLFRCLRETAHPSVQRLAVAAEMTSLNTFTIRSTSPRSGSIAVVPM